MPETLLSRRHCLRTAAALAAPAAGWLWPQGALSIALQQHTSGSYGLIWQHEGLARRVATSNTEAYAAHIRQRGVSTAMPAP